MEDETPQGGQQGNPKTVAHEHFQRVVEAKRGLESRVEELQGQLSAAMEKAATAETLSSQIRDLEGKLRTSESKFSNYVTVSDELKTSDKDVIETALMFHQRAGEDAPPLADWLGGFREDPSTAPTPLRGLFQPQDGTQAKVEPRITGNTKTPNAPAQVTAEALRAAREKATATGDWSDWSALVKAR